MSLCPSFNLSSLALPHEMPSPSCSHAVLYHDTSDDVNATSSWKRSDELTRLAAATLDNKVPDSRRRDVPRPSSFPAPLVMPDDLLAVEEDEAPQPLHEFASNKHRNRVTPARRTLYVIDSPNFMNETEYLQGWQDPLVPSGPENKPPRGSTSASQPSVDDLAEYVAAFYHGLDVKVLKNHFRFVPWTEKKRKAGASGEGRYVGLAGNPPPSSPQQGEVVTRIRHRPSKDGLATHGQLNLNDLLDGLLAALPADAFAAALLMRHDMYEDEQDDFCCGRAYGASRICVASTFRYHPKLGPFEGISLEHTWPASHCREYADNLWGCMREEDDKATSVRRGFNSSQMVKVPHPTTRKGKKDPSGSRSDADHEGLMPPLVAAILAAKDYSTPKTKADWDALWLARACVVTVHEFGHCIGIAHCTYYACAMQGTASVAEDTQQPPYLCPVCSSQVSYSIAVEPVLKAEKLGVVQDRERRRIELDREWTLGQYTALKHFAAKKGGGTAMFRGLEAWIDMRLLEMRTDGDSNERDRSRYRKEPVESNRSASYFAELIDLT